MLFFPPNQTWQHFDLFCQLFCLSVSVCQPICVSVCLSVCPYIYFSFSLSCLFYWNWYGASYAKYVLKPAQVLTLHISFFFSFYGSATGDHCCDAFHFLVVNEAIYTIIQRTNHAQNSVKMPRNLTTSPSASSAIKHYFYTTSCSLFCISPPPALYSA